MVKLYLLGIIRCRKYTKSIPLCMRILYVSMLGAFSKIFGGFFNKKFKDALQNTNKEYIFDTDFGKFLCGDFDSYLHINENYEPEIQSVINKIMKEYRGNENQYFINIGCNIGYYTISLAKRFGYNVLGFEPNPRTFYYLKCNAVLSNLDEKIKLYNIGLGNENSVLKFASGFGCSSMAHIIENNPILERQNYQGDIIDVSVKRFDDLGIEKSVIENTRLIIIDVEGFELNVIRGMKESLKKFHDIHIIMEIWNDSTNKNDTIKFMKELGYSVMQIDEENWIFKK